MHHLVDHVAALDRDVRGADRQLVGLPGVLGVLLHGGGEFFHAGGGLFQAGGLLFGALRQVGVARGDFLGRGVDRFGRFLDPADDLGQLLHRRVGVVLQLPEGALVVAGDLLGQVALRQRTQHAHHFVQADRTGLHQLVDALRHLQEESGLAFHGDALRKVTTCRCSNDVGDLFFDRHFGGAVYPFHGRTEVIALHR